jgi:hypothetical protein
LAAFVAVIPTTFGTLTVPVLVPVDVEVAVDVDGCSCQSFRIALSSAPLIPVLLDVLPVITIVELVELDFFLLECVEFHHA